MRRTLRLRSRLFAGFAVTLVAAAALMVAVIYTGIRYLPSYQLSTVAPHRLPVAGAAPADAVAGGTVPGTTVPGDLTQGSPARTLIIQDKQDVWQTVLVLSVTGLTTVTVLGLGAGWIITKRLLAPLRTINHAAATAATGDLSARINADGPDDDLKELADTFDRMLARLEQSLSAHRRFAANASHQLLTPLATNRAVLQVAAADPTGAVLTELAPTLVETNERNIAIVTGLLRLADAQHVDPGSEPVDLAALAAEAVRERRALAREHGIELTLETGGRCEVPGSSTLLGQLVANLLDNALTYNHPGGSVRLSVYRADGVHLEVDNTGPLLDPATAHRLFEPFYRPQGRVHRDGHGHGLGLAIVDSIATAHHGTATATARPAGGLTVTVELPPHHPAEREPDLTPGQPVSPKVSRSS
ncbi:HAMP domain-containing histidine kinase [Kitasatospora sp. NBC_00070]|uniref:sensor histidine kinase n=1 Tax=Kitasatospora sp. NBC_00070 TaxID=2975962 RepID=UPI003243B986